MASVFSYITGISGELLMLFGVAFLITYFLYRRYSATGSGRKLPPALPSIPIVGSLPFLPGYTIKDLALFGNSEKNKLGKILSFRLGST